MIIKYVLCILITVIVSALLHAAAQCIGAYKLNGFRASTSAWPRVTSKSTIVGQLPSAAC